jgi:glycoprotein 3-alpha-L-fucosyltransferase
MRVHVKTLFFWIAAFGVCSLLVLQILDAKSAADQRSSAQASEDVMAAANSRPSASNTTVADRATIEALFPHGDETDDRVLKQMQLQLPVTSNKTILAYNGDKHSGNVRFVESQCPMRNCYVTFDHKALATADAVLFKGALPKSTVFKLANNPNQVRILYQLESPHHSSNYQKMGHIVNWTATYRRDSVINTPYARFTPFPGSVLPDKPARNYALGKSKLVAWFVSNCNAPNGRSNYVKELKKHITVDIYGACGTLKCPRTDAKQCFEYLNTDYKFYLAFENSNCKDYIT